jgi:hypothetical protein
MAQQPEGGWKRPSPFIFSLEPSQTKKGAPMTHTLHTDHYFHIGESHRRSGKPCQDYSLSGIHDETAFAVISDGCSSGKETDIGARLISLITVAALKAVTEARDTIDSEFIQEHVRSFQQKHLNKATSVLGLHGDDLIATQLYAYVEKQNISIEVQGDGVVAIRLRNGNLIAHRFEWDENMPFYPAYRNDRIEEFVAAHGNDPAQNRLTEECWMTDDHQTWTPCFPALRHTLQSGIDGIRIDFGPEEFSEIEYVALFTDGIAQIERTDWKDAIAEFLGFKYATGAFIKRRMMRGLENMGKTGSILQDDIACAIIRMERHNENERGGSS